MRNVRMKDIIYKELSGEIYVFQERNIQATIISLFIWRILF